MGNISPKIVIQLFKTYEISNSTNENDINNDEFEIIDISNNHDKAFIEIHKGLVNMMALQTRYI